MNDNNTITARALTWLRQEQVWGFMVSVVVMAIVSVGFFMPDNFEGNTLSQSDMVQGAANGEEARAYYEATGEKALWTNALFSGMPTFQISPSYDSNSLFDWINSVYGLGLPAPSNLLFMMMMGMLIMLYCWRLRWWYALVGALAWGLSSYFVIIIGAGHIWKFVALAYMPPTIGALALAYRGRYLAGGTIMALFAMLELNANHPQITYYSLFIIGALVIGQLVTAIRRRQMRRWVTASAVCLAGGLLALAANAPSLYNTYEYAKETKRAASELSAPANDDNTPAEKPTGGLPRGEIGGWSNTPSESFTLLIPNLKGGASARLYQGQMVHNSLAEKAADSDLPAARDNAVKYLLNFMSQYYGGKMDSGGTNGPFYVGALIFALFLLGCFVVKGVEKWVLIALTLLSVLLAMGDHFAALTDLFIDYVPLYNKFRAAETTLVIACLTIPLLAMLGLQRVLTAETPWRTYRKAIFTAFAIPVVLSAAGWLFPGIYGDNMHAYADDPEIILARAAQPYVQAYQNNDISLEDAQQTLAVLEDSMPQALKVAHELRNNALSADAGRSLLILLIGGAVIILGAMRRVKAGAAVATVGLITLLDQWNVDKRYVNSDSFVSDLATFHNPLAPDAIDRKISTDKGYYRVFDADEPSGAARSFHHHMITGYHAAKLNRYNDLLDRQKLLLPGVINMLNTKYIIQNHNVIPNPSALGPAWLVDSLTYVDNADAEFAALDNLDPSTRAVADKRFSDILGTACPSRVPGDTVVMTKYTPNTLDYRVTTRSGGVIVFSEVWFPWGWKAAIDGKPAELARVNYVLRAMRVPAGSHTVSMTFDPDSIHVTSAIAYGAVTIIYLLVLTSLFVAACPGILSRKPKTTGDTPAVKS